MGTLTDDVYHGIKLRIVELRMAPGASFTEAELATKLGVSKTPVREALLRLRREGLVEVVPRLGYRVAPVTIKDARDLCALRAILEAEAAQAAAMRSEASAPLRELETLCRASYRSDDPRSIQEFLHHNSRFHLTIAELGGNQRLVRMLREVLDESERLFQLGLTLSFRSGDIVHEHSELVDAIIAGDATRAREISLLQSHSSQKMVIEALLSSDAVLETNLVPLHRKRGAQ